MSDNESPIVSRYTIGVDFVDYVETDKRKLILSAIDDLLSSTTVGDNPAVIECKVVNVSGGIRVRVTATLEIGVT